MELIINKRFVLCHHHQESKSCLVPNFCKKIGVCFIVYGVLLGNVLYEFFGKSVNLVNLFMLLGVLLLIDYSNIFRLKFPSFKKVMIFPFILQIYILFLFLLSGGERLASGDSFCVDLFYIFFSVGLIIALSTNSAKIEWSKCLNMMFLFSTTIIFLVTYVILTTPSFSFNRRFMFSSGADPLQMGIGLSLCLVPILFFSTKNLFLKIIKIFDLAFLIVCELAFQCRTGIFACLFISIIFFITYFRLNIKKPKRSIKMVISLFFFAFLFFILSQIIPSANKVVINVFEFAKRGFNTFFSNFTYGVDASAKERLLTRAEAINRINSNNNLLTALFGQGYNTMYVDVPILQAFLDFGLIGGCLYSFVVIVYPLYICFSHRRMLRARQNQNYKIQWALFDFLAFTSICKQLTSALPYGHDVYWGSIFCFYFCSNIVFSKKITK